ncbi:MAG TPA: dihydrolipoamide acetyltransferase family protein [Vicinamibacterales bacterium]|nr:dihydrolipoamide acetyltransferase family protein [Vicinamibacterales bacterium]
MAKQVVMPQMGESVAEGTIVRWLKKVGDAVERDEPLFEISTDKVDAEIPSPSAGVLSEVKVQEGATVPINTVVAVIDDTASKPVPSAPAARIAPAAPIAPSAPSAPVSSAQGDGDTSGRFGPYAPVVESAPTAPKAPSAPVAPKAPRAPIAPVAPGLARPWSAAEARELRLSPVVRKIAREHHIDVRNIAGSGEGGRVTKSDILAYIDAGSPASAPGAGDGATARQAPVAPSAPLLAPNPSATAGLDASKYERTPMSVMRRKIAEHMVMSRRVSPHVHSAFEIDFTKVDEIRKAKKADYEKAGGKLTYMSFITKACAEALKKVPIVNASVDGTDIIYKKDVNIGVAVALDWGLIVPVVKNADTLSLLDISKAIADLASRAREKKLKPEDVQGGTFTITNPGVFGALFGMAIISQPQLAIVGVGAVEKRPVVIDDAVTVRLRAYMTIGYDHRVIDGAIADEFMQVVKKAIENWDSASA